MQDVASIVLSFHTHTQADLLWGNLQEVRLIHFALCSHSSCTFSLFLFPFLYPLPITHFSVSLSVHTQPLFLRNTINIRLIVKIPKRLLDPLRLGVRREEAAAVAAVKAAAVKAVAVKAAAALRYPMGDHKTCRCPRTSSTTPGRRVSTRWERRRLWKSNAAKTRMQRARLICSGSERVLGVGAA